MTKSEEQKLIYVGLAGLAAYFLLFRRDPITGKTPIDNLFAGAGGQLITAPVSFAEGAGNAVIEAVVPINACVRSMQAGDISGVIWNCSAATAYDWNNLGRPTNCTLRAGASNNLIESNIADGSIICQ